MRTNRMLCTHVHTHTRTHTPQGQLQVTFRDAAGKPLTQLDSIDLSLARHDFHWGTAVNHVNSTDEYWDTAAKYFNSMVNECVARCAARGPHLV